MSNAAPVARPGVNPTAAPRPPGASPAEGVRQSLFAVQAELKSTLQQALSSGIVVPFEQEIERVRAPIGGMPLIVWLHIPSGQLAFTLVEVLGLDPVTGSAIAAGDPLSCRDAYKDAFRWSATLPRGPITWLCTFGDVAPDLRDWLAFDADVVVTGMPAVGMGAAGVCWELGAAPNTSAGQNGVSGARSDPVLLPLAADDFADWLRLPWLADLRHPLREACLVRSRLWRAQFLLASIEQLTTENNRRLKSRRSRDEIRTKQLDHDLAHDPLKAAGDIARVELETQTTTLQRSVLELGRITFGMDGTLLGSVRGAIDRVAAQDLIPIQGQETDRLRLNDRTHAGIVEVLKQHLRNALKQDWAALEDGRLQMADLIRDRVGATLALDGGTEQAYLQNFSPLIVIENAYSGEIPRASFLKHLSHGKQAVFTAMGVLTLIGMFLQSNWRQHYWVVLLLLPLFVAGVYMSARSLKNEIAARSAKEVDKAKEILLRDVKKVVADIQRERQSRIQGFVDTLKREAMRQIDGHLRAVAQKRADELQRLRAELRDRSRATENKIRDSMTSASAFGRARTTISQALFEADRAIRGAAELAKSPS